MAKEEAFTITYGKPPKSTEVRVIGLKKTRKKIVADPKTGHLYWYDATRERWCRVKNGLYSAYRMIAEMQITHKRELPLIENIAETAALLQGEIEVTTLAISETSRVRILPAIREAAIQLNNAVDQNKVDAKSQFCALLLWRDRKGRINSGVFACRNATAVRRLRQRLEAISSMKPWLAYYQTSLGEIIREVQNTLENVKRRIEKAIGLEKDMWAGEAKHPEPYRQWTILLQESHDLLQEIPPVAPHSRAVSLLLEEIEEMQIIAKQAGNKHEVLEKMLQRVVDVITFRTQRVHIEGILSEVRLCMRMSGLWTNERRAELGLRIERIANECKKIQPTTWKRPAAYTRCLEKLQETFQLLTEQAEARKIHNALKQAARI